MKHLLIFFSYAVCLIAQLVSAHSVLRGLTGKHGGDRVDIRAPGSALLDGSTTLYDASRNLRSGFKRPMFGPGSSISPRAIPVAKKSPEPQKTIPKVKNQSSPAVKPSKPVASDSSKKGGVSKVKTGGKPTVAAPKLGRTLKNNAKAVTNSKASGRPSNTNAKKPASLKTGAPKTATSKTGGTKKAESQCTGKLQRRGQCFSSKPNQRKIDDRDRGEGRHRPYREVSSDGQYAAQGYSIDHLDGSQSYRRPHHGTFQVRRPSQSPPRDRGSGAKGVFELHGPSQIATEFSDPAWKQYSVPLGQKRTVYVSDKNHFHTTVKSIPPGKHIGSISGVDVQLRTPNTGGKTVAATRGPSGIKEFTSQEQTAPRTFSASNKDSSRGLPPAQPGNAVYMKFDTEGRTKNLYSAAGRPGQGQDKWYK